MAMRMDREAKRGHIEEDIHHIGEARRRLEKTAESIAEAEDCLKICRKMLCTRDNGEDISGNTFACLEEKVCNYGDKIVSDLSKNFSRVNRVSRFIPVRIRRKPMKSAPDLSRELSMLLLKTAHFLSAFPCWGSGYLLPRISAGSGRWRARPSIETN